MEKHHTSSCVSVHAGEPGDIGPSPAIRRRDGTEVIADAKPFARAAGCKGASVSRNGAVLSRRQPARALASRPTPRFHPRSYANTSSVPPSVRQVHFALAPVGGCSGPCSAFF